MYTDVNHCVWLEERTGGRWKMVLTYWQSVLIIKPNSSCQSRGPRLHFGCGLPSTLFIDCQTRLWQCWQTSSRGAICLVIGLWRWYSNCSSVRLLQMVVSEVWPVKCFIDFRSAWLVLLRLSLQSFPHWITRFLVSFSLTPQMQMHCC